MREITISPISEIVSHGEIEPTNTDLILKYFAEESGFPIERVARQLIDVSPDFELEPEDVVKKYFPEKAGTSRDLGRSLINSYQRYSDKRKGENAVRGYFWRDVLANLLHQDEWRKAYHDKWYDVVAGNGLADARKSNLGWEVESIPNIIESMQEYSPETIEMLRSELKFGESVESRLAPVQRGLFTVHQIGKSIQASGKIPITRMMFFNDESKKLEFQNFIKDSPEFVNRYVQNLRYYTLSQIEEHTDIARPRTPLSSWTHLPASYPWRYGMGHLGRAPALMLVSEVDFKETIWARQLMEWSTWEYPEEWRWYAELNYDANHVESPSSTFLINYLKESKKAALVASEGEVVVWGKLPVKGIVDFG